MNSSMDAGVQQWIETQVGPLASSAKTSLGSSGWSSQAMWALADGRKLFVKTAASGDASEMFEGEALGLQAMHATKSLRIPEVYGTATVSSGSFIVMEHLDLRGRGNQAALGRAIANMHKAPPLAEEAASGAFGFPVDNTIGGTPQPNPWTDDWVTFFGEHRLRHMLRLINDSSLTAMGDTLIANMGSLFEGVEVQPATLHGDLWSGNIASVDGAPSVFDPAVYYGHSEAEFGMSWCAGFSGAFWDAYWGEFPGGKPQGFERRHQLYQLYHYLNHMVLFGGGYRGQCDQLLRVLTRNM